MKLGVSKSELLSDVRIAKLYDEYKKKQSGSGRMQGKGIWEGFVKFLKDSKIISNVGQVLLPAAGGALGGTLGTAFSPVGTATGTALGAAAGKSAADWIKSQGFGKRKMMMGKGGMSNLSISPVGQRLGQRGMRGKGITFGLNGVIQTIPGTKQNGKGVTAYNTVSSSFGNVKF